MIIRLEEKKLMINIYFSNEKHFFLFCIKNISLLKSCPDNNKLNKNRITQFGAVFEHRTIL